MAKLTICGGGNAAHVLIALAAHAGWEVDVFTTLSDEAERLQDGVARRGGIAAKVNGSEIVGRSRRISTHPAEVIPGSELVLLALPAFAHGLTLQAIAKYLDANVSVGALPARGGFDLQAHSLLDTVRLPVIFGLQTLPWACRITVYGQEVEILGTKAVVDVAAEPSADVSAVIRQLSFVPEVAFTPVSSLLTLTLANTGQLIHPGIMYGLCHGREGQAYPGDSLPLFYQGVDDFTADILQAMSDEVQSVAGAIADAIPGFKREEVASLYDWLVRSYPNTIQDSGTLRSAFVTNRAYAGLRVPTRPVAGADNTCVVDFLARYLSEDVPFGLVVLRGIAELAGVETLVLDQVIAWAQERLGRCYLVEGNLAGGDLAQTRAPQVYGIQELRRLL